jgi:signal transduction histidine kinase
MRAEIDTMSRTISDLLLLAREGTLPMQQTTVDLSALCEEAWDTARSRAGKQVSFEKQIGPGVSLEGDRDLVVRMLTNLIENAIQYTPANGSVQLRLRRVEDGAEIEVEDTGVGIPRSELGHVFERFYRGQDARRMRSDGTGLGLAIVQRVVESLRGRVEISSELGKGTAVRVTLPVSPQSSETQAPQVPALAT